MKCCFCGLKCVNSACNFCTYDNILFSQTNQILKKLQENTSDNNKLYARFFFEIIYPVVKYPIPNFSKDTNYVLFIWDNMICGIGEKDLYICEKEGVKTHMQWNFDSIKTICNKLHKLHI